jgi:hypothetical protein
LDIHWYARLFLSRRWFSMRDDRYKSAVTQIPDDAGFGVDPIHWPKIEHAPHLAVRVESTTLLAE